MFSKTVKKKNHHRISLNTLTSTQTRT